MIKNKNIDPSAEIASDKIVTTLSGKTLTTATLTSPTITGATLTTPTMTIADDASLTFGTTKPVTIKSNSTRGVLEVGTLGVGVEILSPLAKDRFELVEYFQKAPQLTGVTQLPAADAYDTSDLLASLNANRNFEVLGTNAVSADVAQYVEGGISVQSHGAQNDSTIILPHLVATQSPWAKVTWGTDQSTRWECCLETPAAVTELVIWAGLKKTNTPVVTTDTDQAFFILDTAAASEGTKWHAVYSINNVDTDAAVGSAVTAATKYKLAIDINSSRIAKFYLDGTLVATSTALTTAVDLIPYIAIKDLSAGSARIMYVFSQAISRKPGAA